MNFADRFKGRTSIMTKEGILGLVKSSKIPVSKRSDSPEITSSEFSSPSKTSPSRILTPIHKPSRDRNTRFQTPQPKAPLAEYSANIVGGFSPQTPDPKIFTNHSNKPLFTPSNNSQITKDDTRTSIWDQRRSMTLGDKTPPQRDSVLLSSNTWNTNSRFNDAYNRSSHSQKEKKTFRSQSTTPSRVSMTEEYLPSQIIASPPRTREKQEEIKTSPRPKYSRLYKRPEPENSKSFTKHRFSFIEESDDQKILPAINQNDISEISHKGSISQRDLSGYTNENNIRLIPIPTQEDEDMIAQIVEAKVVQYLDNLCGIDSDRKSMSPNTRRGANSNLDQNQGQNSPQKRRPTRGQQFDVIENKRFGYNTPTRRPGVEGGRKKLLSRMSFEPRELLDKIRDKSVDKTFHQPSTPPHEPQANTSKDESGKEANQGSPFHKLTRRRLIQPNNS